MKLVGVFLLTLLSFGPPSFAEAADLADYEVLKDRVREAIHEGGERTADAVERERVRTNWEVGKLIEEHILLNKTRAHYGERVLKRLSADLALSERELYYAVEFARTYPILPAPAKLSWAHYRELLSVNDAEKREEITKRSVRDNLSSKEIRREVRKLRARERLGAGFLHSEEPLVPLKGSLDTYRVVTAVAGEWKGKPVIDLGFSNYFNHPALESGRFKEGDIVSGGTPPLQLVKEASESLLPFQLVSYRAYVLDVTDGDTLWVLIDLGFGFTTKQQLRLRGLDAPEITTRDGQTAKRFVERSLRGGRQAGEARLPAGRAISAPIIITSTRSDKYDRYLADVFYQTKSGEQYLNNRLLEKKLAERV